jgi:hypothetical protein
MLILHPGCYMKKSLTKYLMVIGVLFAHYNLYPQVINAYAKVTAISGTTLTLSNVNQTAHSFAVGDEVVIMQMQDDVIGSNTADNPTFGDLSAIGSAGLYEIRRITDIDGNSTLGYTSASPTTLSLASLTNTYNTGTNSSVQIISFRQMSTTNYTTTGNISALAWDGNVGGVVAMYVPGTLTLNHNIIANGQGFRGGNSSSNYYIGGTGCYTTPYRENNTQHAFKGEGIYKNTTATYNNARAKILTGGGGGIQINTGGGGGGNFTAGGTGGPGWNGTAAGCPFASGGYGYGGIALSAHISGNRIFMGGGGGGGQQNNSVATNGGNGGGIILIKANTIQTSGACGGRSITANGITPSLSGNDGAGGGGAGGSIVFWVNNWAISSTCVLTISANGGNGGTVNSSTHAGGGAGAQGVVIFNGAQPTANITTQTNNGNPGCNNNSNPCNNSAGSASGINGSGILQNTGNPLPVELVFFRATKLSENTALLDWATASETNNSHFSLYKSIDGLNWEKLTDIPGKGNSNAYNSYEFTDFNLLQGTNYYKLTQTDFDGTTKNHGIRFIEADINSDFYIYPNPFDGLINISSNNNISSITILSAEGKTIKTLTGINSNVCSISTDDLAAGIYFIRINNDFGKSYFNKIIKY